MTHFPDGAMTPLARAVSAEIRSEMAVQRITGRELARAAQFASHNYVAMRLRDEKAFTLDDVEQIAEVLKLDPGELVRRAWANHGPRLQFEAEEAQAYELERQAAVVEFRSRYLDTKENKSVDQVLEEVAAELAARRQVIDPAAGSGEFLVRLEREARAALEEEAEAVRAVGRLDRSARDTRPTRKRAMQVMQDQAAREEDAGS